MSFWVRIANLFRGNRLSGERDGQSELHTKDAPRQAHGPTEGGEAFPSLQLHPEKNRAGRVLSWADSLLADAAFGWRQIKKNKVASVAVILSLGLAIGACTSAFRLIDALLLRPLPVAGSERLYILSRQQIGLEGKPSTFDNWAYPAFRLMRTAVKDQAELVAISYAGRIDLTYGSDDEMEKAHVQYVSGWMFDSFGLQPALGRLLTEDDDQQLGAHPYAVLSHDYWMSRFGRDPKVIGRTFRMGNDLYEIVGVAEEPFIGTEPGTVIDIFAPTTMNAAAARSDKVWLRSFALLKPAAMVEPIRGKLAAVSQAFEEQSVKSSVGMTPKAIDDWLSQKLLLEPAPAGVSEMQTDYRRALTALSVLVALVLLIACGNVANLMTAQASARAREMALRVSIGAESWRLVQLVLVESVWLAFLAAAVGGLLAWWSAPLVVRMINPPDNPARLVLPADWRVLGFGLALTAAVTLLFGLAPALHASAVKPAGALKGGEDPHSRRRLMHGLIAAQVAFCFLVLFVAGLFAGTFEHLSSQPTGFSSERLLVLQTVAQHPQPPAAWNQAAEGLRSIPGVETVALAGWPLLTGLSANSYISINDAPPIEILAYFLSVSPGWLDAMKIPLFDGRDFRASDTSPGVAIVNETFAKLFFDGENPVGRSFKKAYGKANYPIKIIGLVRDARYGDMQGPIPPVAYVPFQSVDSGGAPAPQRSGTFVVRTSGPNPLAIAAALRQEVRRAQPELRVSNVRTQEEINQSHTVRERLLAMLALFFAGVALLLAGVGLYGMLGYSVLQRRREIGIRMALGAGPGDIARRVMADVILMVTLGAVSGLVLGMVSVRYIEALLYGVKATDWPMLALPLVAILGAALLAALPPVISAVRIAPIKILRSE
jgi:putative ABC transport system permease protein